MNTPQLSSDGTPSVGEAVTRLVDSVLRVGVSLVSLPLTMLPEESRRHFETGGRDIARGVASILRAVADRIDGSRQPEQK